MCITSVEKGIEGVRKKALRGSEKMHNDRNEKKVVYRA